VQEDDPRRDLLATVITQWRQHLTAGQEYTVQQLINHAINVNDFQRKKCQRADCWTA
jgi:hypothetical protein